jgi:Cu(I)/Ag(I) efflux system membrane fusion protein/cobalt-zinc-cadmium efflux system membrane fusion protein
MMKSSIAERVLPALYVVAISLLLAATVISVHPPVAKAQDKPSGTPAKAKIDLTTAPSPAQKGSNTVKVKLTDPEGKPISGADVTVTFFMAAMPSMSMPEMKTVIKGMDKGAGMYEGEGDLGSAGMWEVTVTAKQNGQTLAMKKLTVKATGGM